MLEYAKALLPYLFMLIVPILTYLLGRGKNNVEIGKLQAETKKASGEEDRSLIGFYQGQVSSLIEQVKEQLQTLEQKERDRMLCEDKLHDLEVKFNALSAKFTLLEKKLS